MIDPTTSTTRRDFLKTTAATGGALASALAFPTVTFGKPDSRKLKIGFIGCGGRGTGAAAQALKADSNVILHAMGDVYANQIERSLTSLKKEINEEGKFDLPKERQFVGLDAYEKVLASGVDTVILTTPPGFRPLHFKAAIDAGKHVFLEKPMATDAPGLRSVMETVKKSREKGLCVQPGFTWRYNLGRREFYKKIHAGEIGDIRAIYATYLTGPVKPMPAPDQRPAGMSDLDWQLRNWYNFVWTCGDGLVEQAVHSVDKIMWGMNDVPPLKCTAVGGRQIPNHEGNIYDHIAVNYEWADGSRAFMAQRQTSNCHSENTDFILGTKGVAEISRRGVVINGPNKWKYEGKDPDMYQTEHDEMFAGIRAGLLVNDGERMCTSTLAAIMGRMAAYTGKEVTWEMALNSKEDLFPKNIAWDMKLPIAPLAMPGRTPFI
ncbi:MAG: twin-arginine translocation signal domain-containing protein [Pedosphaera sp.]|nr:twin-arginine translocation signal domain-containing protein [Pedosphaera sp.]